MAAPSTLQPRPQNADPLKLEASVQAYIRFVDGNTRVFYSGDIRYRGKWQYGHLGYWVQYWKHRIEHETPNGWTGRVAEGAIFRSFDGLRGDKIAQFVKGKGWTS